MRSPASQGTRRMQRDQKAGDSAIASGLLSAILESDSGASPKRPTELRSHRNGRNQPFRIYYARNEMTSLALQFAGKYNRM
jgi:hypothetical protein